MVILLVKITLLATFLVRFIILLYKSDYRVFKCILGLRFQNTPKLKSVAPKLIHKPVGIIRRSVTFTLITTLVIPISFNL